MNKSDLMKSAENVIYKFTLISALALSLGAISGYGIVSVMLTGIFAAIFCKITPGTSLMPVITFLLISMFSLNKIGLGLSTLSFAVGAILAFIFYKNIFINKTINSPEFKGAVILGTALTATILITTEYFAIGAEGNTATEMIKSYISLGFHPNWRTILYGTVVMVVMITFPRKFKKGTKIICAPFAAIIIAYVLNLILIPKSSIISPVKMLEKPEFKINSISSVFSFNEITPSKILFFIFISFAVSLCLMQAKTETERNQKCIYTILSPLLLGYVIPAEEINNKKEFFEGIISAVLSALLMLITNCFERLPVSASAVLLIVLAWQAFDTKTIKLCFNKPVGAIIFLLMTLILMFTNMALGTVICFAMSFVYQYVSKKELFK